MIAVLSVVVIISIAGTAHVAVAQGKICSSSCSTLGMLQSSPGKSCAEIYQINKASRGVSGLYWINTTSGLHQVNCDMELECGGHKGGWTRIVKFDTSKGDACPSEWTKVTTPGATSKSVCQAENNAGCDSTIFPTYDITFNKVCGQMKGYQKGSTNAFYSTAQVTKSIDSHYVDGVSITLGNPHKHVWTYAAELSDDFNYPDWNCPCAATPGPDPPAFVGNHYYCESGDTGTLDHSAYYPSDQLWDGDGCVDANNNCCTNPDMPWFFRQFASPMHDYLEARICKSDTSFYRNPLVESIELYIQ